MPAEAEKLITLRQGRYALKSFLHTPLLAVVRIPLTILPDHENARRLNNVFDSTHNNVCLSTFLFLSSGP